MRVPKQNQLTYEEIASTLNMSPNKVHNTVKIAYNKMIRNLVDDKGYHIFDAVMWLKDQLAMSEKEAIDKLDESNYTRLKNSVSEQPSPDEI